MNPLKRNIDRLSHERRHLVWLLALVLLCMPYLELTKASPVVEEMPCHEQMVMDHDESCMDCGHDAGYSDCRCCGLDSSGSLITQRIAPASEQFHPPIRAGLYPPGWFTVALSPPYRPPISRLA